MTGPKTNWAGTHAYTAPTIAQPRTVDDVVRLVRGSAGPVHALGTRHSFTDLPDTDGILIDTTALDGDAVIDAHARTVTVPAGTRYGVVASQLDAAGWALHNMGSLPHIGVAGATATGTHGSGDRNRVLSAGVRALEYVDATGAVRVVRRGEPDFPALVVGLGAFGVVTAVTLDIRPSYRVRQDAYEGVSWKTLLADLDAVTGAGYSVSVFTRWDGDEVGRVIVKSLVSDDAPPPEHLLGGRRANMGGLFGDDTGGDNLTEFGSPGPWMLRLPHFRLDREPSMGAEIQTEYFVARTDAAPALAAVRALAPRLSPLLGVSELRTAASDDLWLSPAYGLDVLGIHFTWFDRPDEVRAVLPFIEEALEPYDARPHWGKLHGFEAVRMAEVHPRLADARAVFERLDRGGRFVNDHLVRTGVRLAR